MMKIIFVIGTYLTLLFSPTLAQTPLRDYYDQLDFQLLEVACNAVLDSDASPQNKIEAHYYLTKSAMYSNRYQTALMNIEEAINLTVDPEKALELSNIKIVILTLNKDFDLLKKELKKAKKLITDSISTHSVIYHFQVAFAETHYTKVTDKYLYEPENAAMTRRAYELLLLSVRRKKFDFEFNDFIFYPVISGTISMPEPMLDRVRP